MKEQDVTLGKPKRIYRIFIQERKSQKCRTEKGRSFMIKDFQGDSTIDKVKDKLSERALRFYK